MSAPAVPNPGSPEAYEQGCKCPILDNAHGKGWMGVERGWWISAACPLHSMPDPGSPETPEVNR